MSEYEELLRRRARRRTSVPFSTQWLTPQVSNARRLTRALPRSPVAHLVHQDFVLAAIDLDHGAVDEEREVGGEIGDEVRHLFGFCDATQRDAGRGELVSLLERKLHVAGHRVHQAGPAFGAHRAGIDRDEADVVLA